MEPGGGGMGGRGRCRPTHVRRPPAPALAEDSPWRPMAEGVRPDVGFAFPRLVLFTRERDKGSFCALGDRATDIPLGGFGPWKNVYFPAGLRRPSWSVSEGGPRRAGPRSWFAAYVQYAEPDQQAAPHKSQAYAEAEREDHPSARTTLEQINTNRLLRDHRAPPVSGAVPTPHLLEGMGSPSCLPLLNQVARTRVIPITDIRA